MPNEGMGTPIEAITNLGPEKPPEKDLNTSETLRTAEVTKAHERLWENTEKEKFPNALRTVAERIRSWSRKEVTHAEVAAATIAASTTVFAIGITTVEAGTIMRGGAPVPLAKLIYEPGGMATVVGTVATATILAGNKNPLAGELLNKFQPKGLWEKKVQGSTVVLPGIASGLERVADMLDRDAPESSNGPQAA